MISPDLSVMFFALLVSSTVAWLAMPQLKKVAMKHRLVDVPEEDELKIHKDPVSYLGGLAILLGIGAGMVFAGIAYPYLKGELVVIYLVGLLVFAFGFWDDWKWKHITQRKPMQKLALLVVVQAAMAGILLFIGVSPEFFSPLVPPFLVSFSTLLVLSNALNLQDGMDGLAGTLTAISLIGFLAVSLSQGLVLISLLSVVILGGVVGFLYFNLPPASMFMGDSGAYLLGSLLAVLALAVPYLDTWIGAFGVLFLVGVPVFESSWSLGRRVFGGTALFLGDRGHGYDILLKKGHSTKKVLAIFAAIQLLSVSIGVGILLSL